MGIENLGLYNVTIDFNKMTTYIPTSIYYKENDTDTAKIKVKLVKDGVAVDLSLATATIKIITSNKTTINDIAEVTDPSNGIIEYTFPVDALIEGVNFFEVILSENGMVKISPRMAYKVLDSIEDSGIEIETNYPILLTLISDVNEALNAEAIRITNEAARQVLKDQMDTLNVSLNESEVIRQIQEVARQESISDIQTQFNALAPDESTNVEVQLARTDIKGVTHASIKERLDMMESNPNVIWETVEG